MRTVAKAAHHGADGSVHYLSSSVNGSLLIIADPALGLRRIPLDGLCRLISAHPSGAVRYEAIGATESTTVDVAPGREPLISSLGMCMSCFVGPHDFELWPVCPRSPRAKPAPEPEQVLGAQTTVSSSTGTAGRPTESSRGKPSVRVLDIESAPAPVQEEPLSRSEAASRWGPTPGAYW
jgi:hypothetical protein